MERTERLAGETVRLKLANGEELALTVRGISMGRVLQPQDRVVVRALDRPPRMGDVLLFERYDGLVLHRCIGYRSGQTSLLVVKGDTCFREDPPVAVGEVLGLGVGVRRGDRVFVPWTWRRPWSMFAAAASRPRGGVLRWRWHARAMAGRVFRAVVRRWRSRFPGSEADGRTEEQGEP